MYWALDEVRREVQRTLEKKAGIRIKQSEKLIFRTTYKLTEETRKSKSITANI
ncbi:transposase [Paraliobacillus sp. PM-2]|uniref:transposase n=1 Tax=Paraliobacillus sp. PM-2 TaxID=1462524 RepID=UPI0011471439|nr:transposase [Paraliobacillus sp. PM-2]